MVIASVGLWPSLSSRGDELASTSTRAAAEDRRTARERNRAEVERLYQDYFRRYGANTNWLVRPGIIADRASQRIILWAEATGLTEKGDPPEFFIIAQNSGHDYEALTISFAQPSDVHHALCFLGLPPGRRVDFDRLRFWPKGERVLLSLSYRDAEGRTIGPFRMEKLFLDRKTGKPLEVTGLVFTGSDWVEDRAQPGKKVYAADAFDPHSIASNYNEPTTVLDVPRQAPQKEAYNNLTVNPAIRLPEKALVEITLEPEYKGGRRRVVDLTLCAAPKSGLTASDLAQISLELKDAEGKVLNQARDLNGVLAVFTDLTRRGYDPFVTLKPDGRLTVKAMRDLCAVLVSIDTERGIRMDPPQGEDLYYRAFVPNPAYKDRAARFSHPWELRLRKKNEIVSGVLTQITQTWKEDQVQPELTATHFSVSTSAELRNILDEKGPGLGVILVFAAPILTYHDVLQFLAPIRTTHPLIHVFVEEE